MPVGYHISLNSSRQRIEATWTSPLCGMAFDPPRTPLRRSSQRFLNESRPFISSNSSQVAASAGLAALESAFHGIADELEVFVKNVQEMERITEMFEETAESMAMFIQAQKMNTFCVEFPQVRATPIKDRFGG